MILENYYYYFTSAIPPKICDEIVQFGQSLQEDFATTGQISAKEAEGKKEEIKVHRNSNVSWISEPWVYSELHPLIHEANANAGWNFEWDYSEPAQFTRYKLNQYYHWHEDQDVKPFDNQNEAYQGKIRKLSCTLQLSHPDEYEGGDLEFETPNGIFKVDEIRQRGSICVFPSFVKHRVTPVTKGIRHSLVIWNLGYPYK
jgi:PKHD-type hydroxylase